MFVSSHAFFAASTLLSSNRATFYPHKSIVCRERSAMKPKVEEEDDEDPKENNVQQVLRSTWYSDRNGGSV